ncbi:MAG: saccharopine dehydrogenase C-terminal domain-containing protein [Thermoanaerobaculia bacterium]|nr:saccharopine dehydrogenase C-terminal domain-containing protein [Thermoanaerobaculia bacterium]
MQNILVLGAGHAAPYLIHRLLERAEERSWKITVADRDREAARRRVGDHPRGRAESLDLQDAAARAELVRLADVVVDLLPPALQPLVAQDCLRHRCPLVSASYLDPRVRGLDGEARERDVLLLAELGLDPGIDLVSAAHLLNRARSAGGRVLSFESYGAGLPSRPDVNPLTYCVTWNPRNVVMAGAQGAQYLHGGRLHLVPWWRVFRETWTVEVPGLGELEAYANRSSLDYQRSLGLDDVETLVRGTLRYPPWIAAWDLVVRLGMPNEGLRIPDLPERTWAELTSSFLPRGSGPTDVEKGVRSHLGLPAASREMEALRWLGLFRNRRIDGDVQTPAEALVRLLTERLRLPSGVPDRVLLHHRLVVDLPGGRTEEWLSTFVEDGDPEGFTAMARTVGLPAALGAELLLDRKLGVPGCRTPADPELFPILRDALEAAGIRFREERRPL